MNKEWLMKLDTFAAEEKSKAVKFLRGLAISLLIGVVLWIVMICVVLEMVS
jgi:hypothetical protein